MKPKANTIKSVKDIIVMEYGFFVLFIDFFYQDRQIMLCGYVLVCFPTHSSPTT